jgi:hypothetical protein
VKINSASDVMVKYSELPKTNAPRFIVKNARPRHATRNVRNELFD